MTTDSTHYNSPIDVIYLIHNALRAEATGVARRARQLGTADTLAAFAQALHQWASALEEHARIEDTYMTPLLPARPVVQDNEAEHQRLTTLFRELASCLQAVPPQTPLPPRMQRHVLGHVITLCIEHDDHLESEEDIVDLPVVGTICCHSDNIVRVAHYFPKKNGSNVITHGCNSCSNLLHLSREEHGRLWRGDVSIEG